MPNYRRTTIPGATYFFTLVSYRRQKILCTENIRVALRDAITHTRAKYPFTIDAWVLLPDHLHAIWTLPEDDGDYSRRWSMIKRFVTQGVGGAHGIVIGAHGAPYGGSGDGAHDRHGNLITGVGGVRRAHQQPVSPSRLKRREGNIWQRRFWEHQVRDQDDLNRCMDYVHWNPVKHGHVNRVADWPYSTFHRYVREEFYEKDWGGRGVGEDDGFGE